MNSYTTSDPVEEEEVQMNDLDLLEVTWITMTSLIIFVFGMLGNVITVYIYTRSKEQRRKKVFELILAAIDIYALCVLLPIFTFDLYVNEGLSVYFSLAISVVGQSYYTTILCSTICRYVAVYRPFSFNIFIEKWRMRFVVIICVATLFVFGRTVVVKFILTDKFTAVEVIDRMLVTVICLGSIAVLFILIIAKLVKPNELVAQAAEQNPGLRKRHVVAVKTFGAVTLCFLASYASAFIVRNGVLPLSAFYMYFLNHICNPVIYFLFNREFRAKVRDLIRLNPVQSEIT